MSLRQPELKSRCFPGEVGPSRGCRYAGKAHRNKVEVVLDAVAQEDVDLSIFAKATGLIPDVIGP
jgi:hypothetical protein